MDLPAVSRQNACRAALCFTIAAILYGSLYPWRIAAPEMSENPLWIVTHSWPMNLNRYMLRDVALNILLYVPLGFLAYVAFARRRAWLAAAAALGLAAVVAVSVEMAQVFVPGRTASAVDATMNVAGAGLGVALARILGNALAGVAVPPAAAMCAALWAAYQAVPLLPALSQTLVRAKLAAMVAGPWFSPRPLAMGLVEGLVLARLIEEMAGPRRLRWLLAMALCLVPARLIIAGRTVTLPELGGAALAWLVWVAALGGRPRRTLALAILLPAALVADGLAPFAFRGAPGVFYWVPFQAVVWHAPRTALAILFRKLFRYGAAVWLLRRTGWSYSTAAAGIAILLAAVEAAQAYLPARTPETTDPLLALAVAFLLATLERRGRTPRRAARVSK